MLIFASRYKEHCGCGGTGRPVCRQAGTLDKDSVIYAGIPIKKIFITNTTGGCGGTGRHARLRI